MLYAIRMKLTSARPTSEEARAILDALAKRGLVEIDDTLGEPRYFVDPIRLTRGRSRLPQQREHPAAEASTPTTRDRPPVR